MTTNISGFLLFCFLYAIVLRISFWDFRIISNPNCEPLYLTIIRYNYMFYVLNLIVCRPDLCDINYVVNSKNKILCYYSTWWLFKFCLIVKNKCNVNYIQSLMRIFNFISNLSSNLIKGSTLFKNIQTKNAIKLNCIFKNLKWNQKKHKMLLPFSFNSTQMQMLSK